MPPVGRASSPADFLGQELSRGRWPRDRERAPADQPSWPPVTVESPAGREFRPTLGDPDGGRASPGGRHPC